MIRPNPLGGAVDEKEQSNLLIKGAIETTDLCDFSFMIYEEQLPSLQHSVSCTSSRLVFDMWEFSTAENEIWLFMYTARS